MSTGAKIKHKPARASVHRSPVRGRLVLKAADLSSASMASGQPSHKDASRQCSHSDAGPFEAIDV